MDSNKNDPNSSDECTPRIFKPITEIYWTSSHIQYLLNWNVSQTILHSAAVYDDLQFIEKLLRAGSNVNVLDKYDRTPLYYALKNPHNCVEKVCMLLYYGADALTTDTEGHTPFSYTCEMYGGCEQPNRESLCTGLKILIDYFDDTFFNSVYGIKSFLFAIKKCDVLAIGLIRAGFRVSCTKLDFEESSHYLQLIALFYALRYKSAELYKLLWSQMDFDVLKNEIASVDYRVLHEHHSVFSNNRLLPFLLCYLNSCSFSTLEYLECLYLMLDSPVAGNLIQNCYDCKSLYSCSDQIHFLHQVITLFYEKKLPRLDRARIMCTFLSLGLTVGCVEFNIVFRMYNFNVELEATLYSIESYHALNRYKQYLSLLPTFILGIENNYDQMYLLSLYQKEINDRVNHIYAYCYPNYSKRSVLLDSLCYFALSDNVRKELYKLFKESLPHNEKICPLLDKIPNVPSLIELSRNAFRKYILKTHLFKYPYQFHDFIKKLDTTQHVKDVICFRAPIYLM